MESKDLLKYAMIAAGAYLVYVYLKQLGTTTEPVAKIITYSSQPAVQPAPGAIAEIAPIALAPAVVTPAPAPVPVSAILQSVISASAGDAFKDSQGRMPFEHWSYYYNNTDAGKLKPAPGPTQAGIDPATPISAATWWAAMTTQGFSGLGNLGWIRNIDWEVAAATSAWENQWGNPWLT